MKKIKNTGCQHFNVDNFNTIVQQILPYSVHQVLTCVGKNVPQFKEHKKVAQKVTKS